MPHHKQSSENFVRYPEGHLVLRQLNRDFPIISHGKGIYLFDKSGKRYIDASGGALVSTLGHGNQEIAEKIAAQLSKVAYINGTHFTSEVSESLAEKIFNHAKPLGVQRSLFLCSGSEATEAAVKFARQLYKDRGDEKRYKIIARSPSYHGNTLYALSASGRPYYKKLFGPLLHDVVTTPAPYPLWSTLKDYEKEGASFFAQELEKTIQKEGPESILAFIVEPVSGSSTGASLPPAGYFQKIKAVCDRYGILTLADEVMCGSGRTGKFFASEHFGFQPDIVTLGKGLGGGYAPLSAVVVKESHLNEMREKTGVFMHQQTYIHMPAITAAGVAALEYMEEHSVLKNATEVGAYFNAELKKKLLPLPYVMNVTGLGLMAGVEFVEDKQAKKPFDRSKKFIEQLITHAFEKGLILWPNSGQADGTNGDLFMLGPPLIMTRNEADELVEELRTLITEFTARWK